MIIRVLYFVIGIFSLNTIFSIFLLAQYDDPLSLENKYLLSRFENPVVYSTYGSVCGAYSPCSLANGYRLSDQNATFTSNSGSNYFGYTFLGVADVDINVVNVNSLRFELYTEDGNVNRNTNIKAIFKNTSVELGFPVKGKDFYLGNLTTNAESISIRGETTRSGFLNAYFNNIIAEKAKFTFRFSDASGLTGNDIFSINGNMLNIKESTFSDIFATWAFNINVNNFFVQTITWKSSYRYTLVNNTNLVVGNNCNSSCVASKIDGLTLKDSAKFSVENTTLSVDDVIESKSINTIVKIKNGKIAASTTGYTNIFANLILDNGIFEYSNTTNISNNLDIAGTSSIKGVKFNVKNLKINDGAQFTLDIQETTDFLQNTNFSIGNNAVFHLKTKSPISFNNGLTLNNSTINIDTTGLVTINGNTSLVNATFTTTSSAKTSGNMLLNNSNLIVDNSIINSFDVFGASNLKVNKVTIQNLKINDGSNFTLETQETNDFLKNSTFTLGNNVVFNLKSKSAITLNNKIVSNNSKLNFEVSGLNIMGDVDVNQTPIMINTAQDTIINGNLNLNNSEFNSGGNVNISQNLNVLGSNQNGSTLVAKDLNIGGAMVAELTKLNKTTPLFVVESFKVTGPIKLSFDTSSLIKVGEFESYVLVQSQQKIDKVDVDYDTPSNWITLEPSYLSSSGGNVLSLNAQRKYTYEDVLKNAGLGSEFTKSVANAIDKEMADGVVSNELSTYINGLDKTKNAEGLEKALSSSQAVDQEDFINYVSKYSSTILDNVVNYNYVFANNFWVNVDYNNGVQVSEAIDNGMLLMLGYGHIISKGVQWSVFAGASVGSLEASNYISDNMGMYFGSGLHYQNKYRNYFAINGVVGSNTFNTTRSDGALIPYVATNIYNNVDINVEYGKKHSNYIIAGYGNFNAIQLQAYKEEGLGISYSYDENKLYNSADGGLKVGFVSQSKKLKLEAITKLGYKINGGGSNSLDFKIDNTAIKVLDNPVDSAGLYVKPKVGITYRINKKNMLNIDGEYEYMQNGYTNTSFGLAYKILLVK